MFLDEKTKVAIKQQVEKFKWVKGPLRIDITINTRNKKLPDMYNSLPFLYYL